MICTHQLHSHQLRNITALSKACQQVDGHFIPYYPHILSKPRMVPCNILYLEDTRLIGFLSVFFFYEKACEITVLVEPSHRRQGIAKAMIQEILPLLSGKLETAFFSAVPSSTWLQDKGFHYQNTEYQMRLSLKTPLPFEETACQFRLATPADLGSIFKLDDVCFGKQQPFSTQQLINFINHPNNAIVIAELDHQIIGKAHVCDKRISDIAILPELQGQGLGRAMLIYCINNALSKGYRYLELDVETANKRAIQLYTKLDFKVTNSCDFWSKPINLLITPQN